MKDKIFRPNSKINFEKLMEARQEIERLKEKILQMRKLYFEIRDRNNKAIEYLDAVNKSHQKMFVLVDKQYLLDILKGDDNNE